MLITIITRIALVAVSQPTLDLKNPPRPLSAEPPAIQSVEAGSDHTCAVAEGGLRVRCWGRNDFGQLGQGHTMNIGDDEPAGQAKDIPLPGFGGVAEVAAGTNHTCVRSTSGRVRCWGLGSLLGVASAGESIGDDEVISNDDVNIGFLDQDPDQAHLAIDIAVNHLRTCVVLDDNTVRCWGYNDSGELGLGFTSDPIGDDEEAADAPLVPIGAPVRIIEAGGDHVCALTAHGDVRCWGLNNEGQLGYGHDDPVGDDETPAEVGDVDLGGDVVVQLALGGAHTCARTLSGKVRCWGLNAYGQLGYGHTTSIGDNESPASAGYVKVDGTRSVVDIAVGSVHTCAVLDDGGVKCWGYGVQGQLGYGNKKFIGDDETPASVPDVKVGAKVQRLTMGEHACALLESRKTRCWGLNYDGQLGYGHTSLIGDDEAPASAGDVLVF